MSDLVKNLKNVRRNVRRRGVKNSLIVRGAGSAPSITSQLPVNYQSIKRGVSRSEWRKP